MLDTINRPLAQCNGRVQLTQYYKGESVLISLGSEDVKNTAC